MTRDDALITAAKGGEADAWRELYRAHAGRLVRWLERQPEPDEGADDLASEAWLTAATRIADFHGSADDFAGWLFGIARNLESNARRRHRRRATAPTDTVEAPPLPGHDSTVASEDWVQHALAQLPERERDVLTCQEVIGLDGSSTAVALSISPGAVRVARHRGLRRLRSMLAQADGVASARSTSAR